MALYGPGIFPTLKKKPRDKKERNHLLRLRSRREVTLLIQIRDNLPHGLLHADSIVPDMNLRLNRRLIRRTDARKLLDHPLPGLLVQTLGIPLLRHLDRHIDIHLHERQTRALTLRGSLVQLPRLVPVRAVGGDERGDGDAGAVGEELRDLRDAADVLVAVLLGESEVLVQPEADVVAVETVRGDLAVAEELVLEFHGDGGFARGGEAGQPDGQAVLVAELGALVAGHGGGVVGNVAVEKRQGVSFFSFFYRCC